MLKKTKPVSTGYGWVWLLLVLTLSLNNAYAAGIYVRPSDDSNSRLEIKNAIIDGDETNILFWTWPDRSDPDYKKPCSTNFYTVRVRPGLSSVKPLLMVKGACTGLALVHAGLLENGAVRLVAMDRLEEWRDGENILKVDFSSIKGIGSLRVSASEMGSQLIEFSPAGDLLMAVSVSGHSASDWPGVSNVVAGLKPDNQSRWLLKFNDSDEVFTPRKLHAGVAGEALLSVGVVDQTSMVPESETQLLHVTEDGKKSIIKLMTLAEPFDFESIQPGSQEDLQRFYEHQENNQSESVDNLVARAGGSGGFDVLFERESPKPERAGYVLLRIGADGNIMSETNFGTLMKDHGLERWKDFYILGSELVLLSQNTVTQQGVQSKRKTWGQTIISRIDLETLAVDARLVPLDLQYLAAAMNSGDEGQQYLQAQPGSDPVLLTSVGGVPLSVGQRIAKGGWQLHLQESSSDLLAYTEAHDKQMKKAVKDERSRQKKLDKQAASEQMDQDLQANTGMSSKEFESLSKEEQVQQMMQGGNMDAMIAAAMKQVEALQGNLTPEQQAQMQAQMAQVQQMMQPGGTTNPSSAQPVKAETGSSKNNLSLSVDALMRGHLQYKSVDGRAITVSITNRDDGNELFKKEFPGGVIDEYLSLGRYKLPLEQLSVQLKDDNGKVLEDITPKSQ